MDRLDHLREAIRLERQWADIAGSDTCPARNALLPSIAHHRAMYESMTEKWIREGVVIQTEPSAIISEKSAT